MSLENFYTVIKESTSQKYTAAYFEWDRKSHAYIAPNPGNFQRFDNMDEAFDDACEMADFYGVTACYIDKLPYKALIPMGFSGAPNEASNKEEDKS